MPGRFLAGTWREGGHITLARREDTDTETIAAGLHVRFAVPIVASPMALMTKPRRETKLPGTDLLGSMACRLAHERLAGCQSFPALGVWFHGVSIMPQSAGPDHDQRLKVLLKEFFEAFFLCFFPAWAARFEYSGPQKVDHSGYLHLLSVASLNPCANLSPKFCYNGRSLTYWRCRHVTPANHPQTERG